MKLNVKYVLVGLMFVVVQTMNAQLIDQEKKAQKTIKNATKAFQELTTMGEDQAIPQKLLSEAEGIVVFPKALKVAIGIGGQGGKGIAIIKKSDGTWSNPFFLGMGEGSVGAQIGVQSADIIMLFKDKDNILDLEKADVTLGGDVGVAVGPVGRNSSASTDINFDAEIYSYSKSKGLYAGISLEGTVLKAHKKMNTAYYDTIDMNKIFEKVPTPYNTEIRKLLTAVKNSY